MLAKSWKDASRPHAADAPGSLDLAHPPTHHRRPRHSAFSLYGLCDPLQRNHLQHLHGPRQVPSHKPNHVTDNATQGSYSILILTYYFVAVHASPNLYNSIALLVLEVLALVFWLACFAALAALYAILVYIGEYYVYDSYRKRDLYMLSVAYTAVLIACLAISVVNLYVGDLYRVFRATLADVSRISIFYCVTLGFTCTAIHRHRKAGLPLTADKSRGGSQGRAVSTWENSAANEMAFATDKTPAATAEPQTTGVPCQYNASLPLPVQNPASAGATANPSSPVPGTVEVAGSR